MRFWYSGVSTDSTVGICTASIIEYQFSMKLPGAYRPLSSPGTVAYVCCVGPPRVFVSAISAS